MTAGVRAGFPRRTCSIAALLVALIASRTAVGLAIIGSGPGTILKLVGNPANTSWSLFQLRNGASKLVFRDFAIDGSAYRRPDRPSSSRSAPGTPAESAT